MIININTDVNYEPGKLYNLNNKQSADFTCMFLEEKTIGWVYNNNRFVSNLFSVIEGRIYKFLDGDNVIDMYQLKTITLSQYCDQKLAADIINNIIFPPQLKCKCFSLNDFETKVTRLNKDCIEIYNDYIKEKKVRR